VTKNKVIAVGGCAVVNVMRFVLVLIALIMLLGAVGFMFFPSAMESDFAVVASRTDGMGTIRGDLGGLFLMLAIFTFYGSWPRKSQWLMVPIVFMLTVMAGRTVHVLIDGVSQAAVRSFALEIVALLVLLWARRVFAAQRSLEL
jgi:hypothetical protein